MNKRMILICATLLCSLSLAAQRIDVLSLNYQPAQGKMRFLMDMVGVKNLNVVIKGNLADYKWYKINGYHCKNGITERLEAPNFMMMKGALPTDGDSLSFEFFSRRVSSDAVLLRCDFTQDSITFSDDGNYILMETLPRRAYGPDEEIPIMAYTLGLVRDVRYNGVESVLIDYCGLRDAREHPSLWYEKHGVKEYIYFTIKFE